MDIQSGSVVRLRREASTWDVLREWGRWAEAGLSARSRGDYRNYIMRFFETMNVEWDDVTLPLLLDYTTGFSVDKRRVFRAAMVSLYDHAQRMGWTTLNPARELPYTRQGRRAAKVHDAKEMRDVLDAASKMSGRVWGAVAFLYATGARISEACDVTDADVDERSDPWTVTLRQKRRPGQAPMDRVVPLNRLGVKAVRALRHNRAVDSPTLFSVTPSAVESWCRKLSDRTGLRVHPHKFRATFATHLLQRGVDARTVQELLGHTSLETTLRYLATSDERKQSAVMSLDG